MQSYDLDRWPLALLTLGNPKTAKGEKYGTLTAILHLAPADLSGRNVCAFSSEGCRAVCLNTAGRGGIALDADGLNPIQVARIRRTRAFSSDQPRFMAQLVTEITRHVARAKRNGLKPAVRLNGTSDLTWENVRIRATGARNIFAMFPDVRFYDYTKAPPSIRRHVAGIPNYSLTFSLSEKNDAHAREAIAAGMNVAVVMNVKRGRPLPATFWGVPVIDGDLSDLRFTDPSGVIVALRAKGRAVKDTAGGFVRSV